MTINDIFKKSGIHSPSVSGGNQFLGLAGLVSQHVHDDHSFMMAVVLDIKASILPPSLLAENMVYYVRFLKTPRTQTKGTGFGVVLTVVCIMTDLGDAFLSDTVQLRATIAHKHTQRIVHQETVVWHAGSREVPISLGPFPLPMLKQTIILGIGPINNARQSGPVFTDHIPDRYKMPLVISGWSAPFSHPGIADKLVERRLCLGNGLQLNVWEETGNNIARHLW